ncbi:MAG: hypothetical protein AVDCRST_MAG68-3880 [uncultured Gemmatimonadetes bacterium]|uniref:Uncharacterized protein n=1 Tax=uncultured Gemmatimonadota bacterium TaxID=203437 RepID=A0A6J4MGV4_9BACT|nr:MAG: hypothetical protein AVDCRST_MAG68-3880 [uncultured Gemmatimonadota bacterium]
MRLAPPAPVAASREWETPSHNRTGEPLGSHRDTEARRMEAVDACERLAYASAYANGG